MRAIVGFYGPVTTRPAHAVFVVRLDGQLAPAYIHLPTWTYADGSCSCITEQTPTMLMPKRRSTVRFKVFFNHSVPWWSCPRRVQDQTSCNGSRRKSVRLQHQHLLTRPLTRATSSSSRSSFPNPDSELLVRKPSAILSNLFGRSHNHISWFLLSFLLPRRFISRLTASTAARLNGAQSKSWSYLPATVITTLNVDSDVEVFIRSSASQAQGLLKSCTVIWWKPG